MSDFDRRAERQGSEPPLTMDRRERARPRSRPRGPAPVTLIVSLVLLVVVVGGVFYMYRSGPRSPNAGPQALGTPLGDVREPAPPQAQTPDPSAGLTISKEDPNAAATAPPTLAPPPEQPQYPAPKPPPSAAPKAASTAALGPPPPPPTDAESSDGTAADAGTGDGETIDHLVDKAAKAKAAPGAGGPVLVQIGAFSSERLADSEWSKAAAVAPGVMAGKGKRVVPVTVDGATLYRTSITGFTSRDQAMALCGKLKAAGGSCFVR